MIDTDKYEGHTEGPWNWTRFRTYPNYIYHLQNAEESKVISCDNSVVLNLSKANKQLIADAPLLLAEFKQLREENDLLRKMDWEYECLWTWLAENTNLLNTIEPLMEEWKKEYDEE